MGRTISYKNDRCRKQESGARGPGSEVSELLATDRNMQHWPLTPAFKEIEMKNFVRTFLVLLFLGAVACAAQDVVSAVHGTISKLDSATRTAVVKTKDGTEHAI